MSNISNELKIYELSLIWKEAEYNFAFWEKLGSSFDWDKAYRDALPRVLATGNLYDYYMELAKFIALLRDGHTDIGFPKSIQDNFAYLPVFFDYIGGKHVITHGDEALGIKQFLPVNKINGVDINDYIQTNILPYIWHEKYDSAFWQINNILQRGEEGSETELEVEENGVTRTLKLKRVKGDKINWAYNNNIKSTGNYDELYSSKSHKIYKTQDNIGIIVIDTFGNDQLGEEFYANQRILEDMKGFIIDVRNNGGGNSSNADNVAKAFIDSEFATGRDLKMVHIGTYKAWGKRQNFGDKTYDEIVAEWGYSEWLEMAYKIPRRSYYVEGKHTVSHEGCPFLLNQPLVVLSSCNTGSAAEDFLVTLDQAKRATIVGSASYGSTGQPLLVELESGGSFRICTRNCTYPDGTKFIDIGVQPHIKCKLSLDDYKNGVDSVMDTGLSEIRKLV
ncbi:MAG: S41 family peptidase [Defluviitaleaceae bacterium]|nr:S41 family peptidase [Defluviitaleaceae bacterium]